MDNLKLGTILDYATFCHFPVTEVQDVDTEQYREHWTEVSMSEFATLIAQYCLPSGAESLEESSDSTNKILYYCKEEETGEPSIHVLLEYSFLYPNGKEDTILSGLSANVITYRTVGLSVQKSIIENSWLHFGPIDANPGVIGKLLDYLNDLILMKGSPFERAMVSRSSNFINKL
jgi:hypothetical protein